VPHTHTHGVSKDSAQKRGTHSADTLSASAGKELSVLPKTLSLHCPCRVPAMAAGAGAAAAAGSGEACVMVTVVVTPDAAAEVTVVVVVGEGWRC
jgi:hypothetical protein